jgi:hypothetical protein
MTGKPSTKAKPASVKKAAKPKPPKPEPAAKKSSDDDVPWDDNPLGDEEQAQTKRASGKVRRKRTKEFPLRVVCPMCETAGFVPRRAAGKDVRCANPECLVPQFTVPSDEADDEVASKPAKKPPMSSTTRMAILLPVLFIAGGGIDWYFLWGPGAPQVTDLVIVVGDNGGDDVSDDTLADDTGLDGDDGKTKPPKKKDDSKPPTLGVDAIQDLALGKMIATSRISRGNRSKPYCRRFAALTYAQLGDLEGAQSQLDQLQVVGTSLPYYRVEPLTAMAWQQLRKSDLDGARATADAAWAAAESLPHGQTQHAAAISLGALLIALDRQGDADQLIAEHREEPPAGYEDLSSLRQIVEALGIYDLDAELSYRTGPTPAIPYQLTLAYDMVANGATDAALKWAKGLANEPQRFNCLIAIAEALTMQATPGASAKVSAITAALNGPNRARLMVRVAVRQWMLGDRAAAKVSLAAARKQLASVKQPPATTLPDLKGIHNWKATNTAPLRAAALAAADIARLEAAFGDPAAAWKAMTQSLAYTRGMAVSPSAIAAVLQEIEDLGPATIQARLKEAFELQTETKARAKLNTYRRQCVLIQERARERFTIQVAVLTQALDWGLSDLVLAEIQARQEAEEPNNHEPFFDSALPWIILDGYQRAGKKPQATALEEQLGELMQTPGPAVQTHREAAKLLDAQQFGEAIAVIESSSLTPEAKAQWLLRNACRLAATDTPEVVFEFIGRFQNPLHREQACELTVALLARRGQVQQVWHFLEKSSMAPTEMVSACRGLSLGAKGIAEASSAETSATP